MSRPSLSLAISLTVWLASGPMDGQEPAANGPSPPPIAPVKRAMDFEWRIAGRPARITYSRRGLELTSPGGNYQARIQLRFSDPFPAAPERAADYQQRGHTFGFRRARLKLEGHAFRPWFRVNIEQDLADFLPKYRGLSIQPETHYKSIT